MSNLSKFIFPALLVAGLSMLTYFGCRQQPPKINPTYRVTPTTVEVSQDPSIQANSVQLFVRKLNGEPVDTVQLDGKNPSVSISIPPDTEALVFEQQYQTSSGQTASHYVTLRLDGIIIAADVVINRSNALAPGDNLCLCTWSAPDTIEKDACIGARRIPWGISDVGFADTRRITINNPVTSKSATFMMNTTATGIANFSDIVNYNCLSSGFCMADEDMSVIYNSVTDGLYFVAKARETRNTSTGAVNGQYIRIMCPSNYVVTVEKLINCNNQ